MKTASIFSFLFIILTLFFVTGVIAQLTLGEINPDSQGVKIVPAGRSPVFDLDGNASSICSGAEVLLGNGTCTVVSGTGAATTTFWTALGQTLFNRTANVGIGTSTPTERLVIQNGSLFHNLTQGSLRPIAEFELANRAKHSRLQGTLLAVDVEQSNTFVFLDVSDPANIFNISTYQIPDSPANPNDMALSGNFLYYTDSTPDAMIILDFSNPAAVVEVGRVSIGGNANEIRVVGDTAYITNSDSSLLSIVDVSIPTAPVLNKTINIGGTSSALATEGRYIYVGNTGLNLLMVFDIIDRRNPINVGNLSVPGGFRVEVQNRIAYLSDITGTNSITIIDVNNASNPTTLSTISVGTSSVRSLFATGDLLYAGVVVSGSSSSMLQVFDVKDPVNPVNLSRLVFSESSQLTDIFVSGKTAFVMDATADKIRVVDVTGFDFVGGKVQTLEVGSLNIRGSTFMEGVLSVFGGINMGSSSISGGIANFLAYEILSGSTVPSEDTVFAVSAIGINNYNDTIDDVLRVAHVTVNGNSGNGIGTAIQFASEDSSNATIITGRIISNLTDVTEDASFSSFAWDIRNGSSTWQRMMLDRDFLRVAANGNFSGTVYINNGTDLSQLISDMSLWESSGQTIFNLTVDNVGIGTNLPLANLHIEDTPGSVIILQRNDTSVSAGNDVGVLDFYGGEDGSEEQVGRIVVEADDAWTLTSSASRMLFFTTSSGSTSGIERMRINSEGFVGIGIGTTLLSNLHLSTTSPDNNINLTFGRASGAPGYTTGLNLGSINWFNQDGTGDGPQFVGDIKTVIADSSGRGGVMVFSTASGLSGVAYPIERMRISQTGLVGIGTPVPTATLEVNGSAIFNENSGDHDFRVESDGNTQMIFVNGGTDQILLAGGGNFAGAVTGTIFMGGDIVLSDATNNIAQDTSTGASGGINILAGNASFGGDGGNIVLQPGLGEGAGDDGDIILSPKSGFVGIRDTTPSFQLDIFGNTSVGTNVPLQTDLNSSVSLYIGENSVPAGIQKPNGEVIIGHAQSANGVGRILGQVSFMSSDGSSTGTGRQGIIAGISESSSGRSAGIAFFAGAGNGAGAANNTETMRITNDNQVGIGVINPALALHVQITTDGNVFRIQDSDGTCSLNPESGSITTTCSSDESLKENIRDADSSSLLSKFMGFIIREYEVRANGETRVGVVAQEVNITNPEMVRIIYRNETIIETEEGGVDSGGKITVEIIRSDPILTVETPNIWELISVIQEQQHLINDLTSRIEALEARP